ncbi:MAG: S24/S26 family peptidase [Lachnospiraceae bacterium]|nr:S24/S26 family peptidase [bacterium]MDY5518250.1 S24/S26 family peptidase [Lachnospiraceae bacterium]
MGETMRKFGMSNNAQKQYKYDIEALLASGQMIRMHPQGTSMYPMFAGAEDEAVIAPADVAKLKRGDVVVYRRDPQAGGLLVMHRIYRRSGDAFYMVGDNQSVIEGPLRGDQIRGILVEWVRCGRTYSVKNIGYRMFFGLWLWMLPLRDPIHKMLSWLRKR